MYRKHGSIEVSNHDNPESWMRNHRKWNTRTMWSCRNKTIGITEPLNHGTWNPWLKLKLENRMVHRMVVAYCCTVYMASRPTRDLGTMRPQPFSSLYRMNDHPPLPPMVCIQTEWLFIPHELPALVKIIIWSFITCSIGSSTLVHVFKLAYKTFVFLNSWPLLTVHKGLLTKVPEPFGEA